MKQSTSVRPVVIFGLDALNGLVVGFVVETARVGYLNYQMSQAARQYAQSDFFVDFTSARWEPLTPFISMLALATIGYLVRRFFNNRPQLLLALWFALGAVAVALGYFMSTSSANLFSLLWWFGLGAMIYPLHRLWKSHPNSLPLLWAVHGISAAIVLAVGIQLVGLFFYWPDLRTPLTWVLCVGAIIATSATLGAMVQLIGNRVGWGKFKVADGQ